MANPFDTSNVSIYGEYAQFEDAGSSAPTGSSRALAFLFASSSSGNAGDTKIYLVNGSGSAAAVATAGSFSFTIAGDAGTPQEVVDGNSITLAGGDGLRSVASATDTVTFHVDVNGLTAHGTVADADTFIVDAADGDDIKKITRANLLGSALAAFSNGLTTTTLSATGDVDLGNATSDTITATGRFDSDLVPSSNNARNLGSNILRYANVWSYKLNSYGSNNGGSAWISGSLVVDNNLVLSGTLNANGDINLGNATGDTITATGRFDSDLVPSGDSARDLGTSALQWAEAHIDTGYIDALTVTGTSTLTTVDIGAGAIDGTTIGAASAAAATVTTLTATTSNLGTLGSNVDHANYNSTNVDIDSGAIDGAIIGANSAAAATVTTLTATTSNLGTLGANVDHANYNSTNVDIDSGAIDGTIIGAASRAAASVTTLDANSTLNVDGATTLNGTVTLGNAAADVTTVTSRLTASTGMLVPDDKPLYFGTGQDASIEYDENGTDELRFAGAAVTFEQAVTFDANVTLGNAASDLITSTGFFTASADMQVNDDKTLYFGTDKDAGIKYDEAASDAFVISGSASGIAMAGGLTPTVDDYYNLGAAGSQWKDLHLDGVAYIDDLRADALGAAMNCASQAMTNVNVDSGVIDDTTIGATTHTTGKFTTVDATTDFTIDGLVLTADTITNDAALSIVSTGLTLNASLDIALSADGGNVTMDDGTTTVFDFNTDDVVFKMMDDAQVANYCSISVGDNGATTLATVDADAAIAHLTITADGTVDIDSAGLMTLDSGGNIALEPAAGSHIKLDDVIQVDSGVVIGATSITSTAFLGTLDGVVGGNTPAAGTFTALIGSTMSGSSTLQVAGTVAVLGGVPSGDIGLALPSGKDAKARSWITYSERSLKTDIRPMANALETVQKMQGVTYALKSDGKKEVGFLADEMAHVVPEVCQFKADGTAAGLDYGRLTSVLVEAIKSQQIQIEELQMKLDR